MMCCLVTGIIIVVSSVWFLSTFGMEGVNENLFSFYALMMYISLSISDLWLRRNLGIMNG